MVIKLVSKTRVKARLNRNANNKTRIKETGVSELRTIVKNNKLNHCKAISEEGSKVTLHPKINRLTVSKEKISVLKNRFILVKVLGSGGMGVVFKAKDILKVEAKDKDPYIAIKVLSEEFKSHPEAFISLQRESRKSQRIAHPNIVNVYDFDRDGDVVFMTMEYMDGRPLDKIIRQYKSIGLPSDDIWSILKEICAALIYAHKMHIIHSDFKPGNIFLTNSGVTKVFDFGIARAVAKVTGLDNPATDNTIFDAGNLGALTPAYASLEMLQGKEPDVRDDIYALGCIAYELFTGRHPFNKTSADEAKRQGLTPKRISVINKQQWNAIKQSLEFSRKDRIESVSEFYNLLFKKRSRKLAYPIVTIILILSLFLVYRPGYRNIHTDTATEMRSKLEYKLQVKYNIEAIEALILNPVFNKEWETQLLQQYILFKKKYLFINKWFTKDKANKTTEWYNSIKAQIFRLYIDEIRKNRAKNHFERTAKLISNIERFDINNPALISEREYLRIAIINYNKNNLKRKVNKIKKSAVKSPQVTKRQFTKLFNVALENVNSQLKCDSRLNMRNLDIAIKKLKKYNNVKYNGLKLLLIKRIVSCINKVGENYPAKAAEYKKYALRMFPGNSLIIALNIKALDPCNVSIAGLGRRGKSTVCNDILKDTNKIGPDLIVVRNSNNNYAISKYEISIKEFNLFCRKTKECNEVKNRNIDLPITNISVKKVKRYLKWLSINSKKKYRLPTKSEWLIASKAKDSFLDPNRNCFLKTRGIAKGEKLFASNIGLPNSWGMVNYVGNAREWVYENGRKLVAIGGSYFSSMEECNFNTIRVSTGKADKLTGFRVLREINK